MHEHDAARVLDERQRPVERGVAAAADHDVLIGVGARILHAIVNVLAFELGSAGHIELARLERAHAARDHDGAGIEHRAPRSVTTRKRPFSCRATSVTSWPRCRPAPNGRICSSNRSVSSWPVHTGTAGMS